MIFCFSVEQFLYEREMDPEKLLKNLGFGFSPDSDTSCGRIPDRFLLSPSSAGGIDLYQFVLQNPDLHHLLWMWEKTSEAQSGSGVSLNQSPGRKTGQLTSQDSMVVGCESGQGNNEENETVCDKKLHSLKQYLEIMFHNVNNPEVSLNILKSVPERYLCKIDKNLGSQDVSLELLESLPERYLGGINKSLISYDNETDPSHVQDQNIGKKDNKQTIEDSVVNGVDRIKEKEDFGESSGTARYKVKTQTAGLEDEQHSSGRDILGSDCDSGRCVQSLLQERETLAENDSESADFKSLGSWSSESSESLQELYSVELDENESLV